MELLDVALGSFFHDHPYLEKVVAWLDEEATIFGAYTNLDDIASGTETTMKELYALKPFLIAKYGYVVVTLYRDGRVEIDDGKKTSQTEPGTTEKLRRLPDVPKQEVEPEEG